LFFVWSPVFDGRWIASARQSKRLSERFGRANGWFGGRKIATRVGRCQEYPSEEKRRVDWRPRLPESRERRGARARRKRKSGDMRGLEAHNSGKLDRLYY